MMQVCPYCQEPMKEKDLFCRTCGYNPETDTIRKDFMPPAKAAKHPKKKTFSGAGGISPAVKNFAFIGLALFVFSIFYKNHFSIRNVAAEVKHFFVMLSKGKVTIGGGSRSQNTEWIDMRTFKEDEPTERF